MNSNVLIIINLTKIYSEKYHLINMNSANGLRCFSVDHFYSIEPNDFSYTYYRRLINNYQQEKNSFITVMLIESPISTRLVAKLKVLAYQNPFCFFVFLHPSDVKWDIDLSFLTGQQGYTILKYNPKNTLPQELHKVRIKAKAILNILAILSLGEGCSGPDIATIFIKNEPAKYMIPFSLKIFYGNNDTERAIQLFYKYKREIESHRYLLMNQDFTVKQLTVVCKNPQTELYLNDFAWSMNCIQESLGFLNQARICACNQNVEAVIPFGWSIEKQMKQDIMLYLGLDFVFFAELESF